MSRIRQHPDYQAMSDALRADNLNPLTWNIFADWLEDNDAPLRAELLRLRSQCINLNCENGMCQEPHQWHMFCTCKNCNKRRAIKNKDRELCEQIERTGE